MIKIGILCVNFDTAPLIDANFSKYSSPLFAVYIGDNFVSSDTRAQILEVCQNKGFSLHFFSKNIGFGEAINHLANLAIADGCTHLLLQNPDCEIGIPEVKALLNFSILNNDTIVSPTIFTNAHDIWFQGAKIDFNRGLAHHSPKSPDNDWLTAACLLLPVSIWEKLAGFSSGYFLYWEDVDLTFRWLRMGGRLVVHRATARHDVGASQKTNSALKSPAYIKFNSRNRLLFAGKNLGLRDLLRWGFWSFNYYVELMSRAQVQGRVKTLFYFYSFLLGGAQGILLGLGSWSARKFSRKIVAEKLEAKKKSFDLCHLEVHDIQELNPEPNFFVYPYYADNPWQKMMYQFFAEKGINLRTDVGSDLFDPESELLPGDIIHINWTAPLTQLAESAEAATTRVMEITSSLSRAKELGVRIVWTVHNILPHECNYYEAEILLLNYLADAANAIHVMNPKTAKIVQPLYKLPRSKLWYLPHSSYVGFLPPSIPMSDARSELGIKPDAAVLLFLGEIREYKNVNKIIESFRRISSSSAVLFVAGRPGTEKLRDYLEDMARFDPRIKLMLGRLPDEIVATVYSAADLMIVAHRNGLNSGSIALAGTYCCPVAHTGGAEAEVIKDEKWGLYVDLEQDLTSEFSLESRLNFSVENSTTLRELEAKWAHAMRSELIAKEFTDGILEISRLGKLDTLSEKTLFSSGA